MRAIIFLLAFVMTPEAAHAQRPDWTAAGLPQTLVVCTRTGDTANIRRGAGTSHPVVASLANGSQARVVDEARFAGRWSWFRILHIHPDLPSHTVDGWVHGTLLARDCSVAHDPAVAGSRGSVIGGTDLGMVAAPDDGPGSVWLVETCTANGDTVNVRAGPGTQHRVLAALENGTGLRVRAGDPRNPRAWLRVELVDDLQSEFHGVAVDGYLLSRLAVTGMCPVLHDPAVAGTSASRVGGRIVTLGPWDPYHDLHINNPGHPQSRRILDVAMPAYQAKLARDGHGEEREAGSLYAQEDAQEAERQGRAVSQAAVGEPADRDRNAGTSAGRKSADPASAFAALARPQSPPPGAGSPPPAAPVCDTRRLVPPESGVGHFVAASADGRPQVFWSDLRPDRRISRISLAVDGTPEVAAGEIEARQPLVLTDQTLRHVGVWAGPARLSSGKRELALAFADHGGPGGGEIEFTFPPPGELGLHAHRNGDGSLTLLLARGGALRELVSLRAGRAGGWQSERVVPAGYGGRIAHAFGASHPNGDLTAIWSEPFAQGASMDRPHLYMATRAATSGRWSSPVRIAAIGSDRVSVENGFSGAVGLDGGLLLWWSSSGSPLRVARIGPDGRVTGGVMTPQGDHTLLAGAAAPWGEAVFVLGHARGAVSWVRVTNGKMGSPEPIEGLTMLRSAGVPQIVPTREGDFWLVQRSGRGDRVLRLDRRSGRWSPETLSDNAPPRDDPVHARATSAGPAVALPDGSLALATNLARRAGSSHDVLVRVCR